MNDKIDDLLEKLKSLEDELDDELRKRREEFHFVIEEKRVRFAQEVVRQQRQFKTGTVNYLSDAKPLNLASAPLVYAGIVFFVVLDLFLMLYQAICFPIYGIPKVKRSEYFVFDRADLPYLNLIERFNCFYCSYGNGLAAYFREVAARTEQYWCPIKHARRIKATHSAYARFFEYGDVESYRKGLERLRDEYPK
jgi:hypothetical protein